MSREIDRRTCLKGLAFGAATAAGWRATLPALAQATSAPASAPTSAPARASVHVLLGEPILDPAGKPAIIEPAVHGHFVEHIGAVVYDGIWVGPDSKIANVGGLRKDVLESLKKLAPPVIRYPGGCFADGYHWRDGIGPRDKRPRTYGRWNEGTESNQFGTHEFMRFCRTVGAEPYLCANLQTGTPEEFHKWVEYCNCPADRTTLADERETNGDHEPFRVRYWGVGNENWDCGGKFTPEDYCTEYRRFVTWAPNYGPPLQFIASGPNAHDIQWTHRFMKKWVDSVRAPLHGWAPHYYCGTSGTATRFTNDQWYDLLDKGNQMEPLVVNNWNALGEYDPQHTVRLTVDEWGCWHPKDGLLPEALTFGQVSTMRDALVAALTLDTFHRHAEKVRMSNVAQLVNCLQSMYLTDGERFVETVNYHVFRMYRPHQAATAVPLKVEADNVRYTRGDKTAELFRIAGSASVRQRSATVTLVHTHVSEPLEVQVDLRGGSIKSVKGTVLAHEHLNAANTFDHPQEVMPRELPVAPAENGTFVVKLPPACVASLQIELA
jgi:alpha-L-arabinofuranosidase